MALLVVGEVFSALSRTANQKGTKKPLGSALLSEVSVRIAGCLLKGPSKNFGAVHQTGQGEGLLSPSPTARNVLVFFNWPGLLTD